MAAVSRELAITYAGLTVGGFSETYQLHDFSDATVTDGTAESSFSFTVIVTAASEAAFAAACRALENAYRTPRKSLVVSQNGSVLTLVSHDTASGGFNTDPDIEKPGSPEDSGLSRLYRCRVKYETPADRVSTKGLRERTINVEYDASRIRTIRIAGTFTAGSGTNSARSRYEAAIGALVTSALSGLSVTASELISEPFTEQDYDDKVIRFERVYRELIFGQGQDSPSDDDGLTDQVLTISRRNFSTERSEKGGGGTPSASAEIKELAVFDLHYEANVSKDDTTDLFAKYRSIKNWLIGQFNAVFNQNEFALVSERVQPDRPRNRLVVDLVAEGGVDGFEFVRRTLSVQDRVVEAKTFANVHDGNALSRYKYQGFADVVRIVTESYRKKGTVTVAEAARNAIALAKSFRSAPVGETFSAGGSWELMEHQKDPTVVKIGIPGSTKTLEMTDVRSTVNMVYVKVKRSGPSQTVGGPPPQRSTPASGTPSGGSVA